MSKLVLFALLCMLAIVPSTLCQDVSVDNLLTYNKWRFTNKRVFLNDEEQIYRQSVFFENLKRVQDHVNNKQATYEVGLNQFSDMTTDEFQNSILNKRLSQRSDNIRNLQKDDMVSNMTFPTPPVSVDWRTKGVLTPIKNQGRCGSCWTFSVVGVLESFNKIKNNVLEQYSEQQLVDCAKEDPSRSDGCNGGFQEDGIRYSIKYGVVRQSSYPYIGYQSKCKITSKIQPSQGFIPKKYQQVLDTPQGLQAALGYSPVVATVDASTWQNYSRGIFNGCSKTTMEQLNHAIIAVGYDNQGNWIIRNSWGTKWGESGYIRLAAGDTCGILLDNQVITE